MVALQAVQPNGRTDTQLDFDAIVIGAGVAGLYQLHKLRELGLRVRAFEAGSNVGGTWYWNRYPGARCDSESHVYWYTFSPELMGEWEWSERDPGQAEILRCLNFRRRPVRPEARHPVQHPRGRRFLRRAGEPLAGAHRGRRDLSRQIPDHRRRLPVNRERAGFSRSG